MPNGRSGGFRIDKPDLERLLVAWTNNTVVGRCAADDNAPVDRNATIADLRHLLREHEAKDLVVEEQDGSWYVIRLETWITVTQDSPLFETFRRCQTEWMRQMRSRQGRRAPGEAAREE